MNIKHLCRNLHMEVLLFLFSWVNTKGQMLEPQGNTYM